MKKVTKSVIPTAGLGHVILKAKSFIGDVPFVIVLGDDIIYNPKKPVTKQMIEKYELYGKSIIGCQEVAKENVFKYLEETNPGKNSEIQLTDGILAMMKDGEDVLAYNFTGKRYDIGSKVGLLKANIEFGFRNEETEDEIRNYLKNLDTDME